MLMTLPSIAQANLLSNPGFEYASDGSTDPGPDVLDWTRWGDGAREDWAAKTGTYGVAFYGWQTASGAGFYQDVAGTAGTQYTFSMWATKEAGYVSDDVILRLEWFEADGTTSTGTGDEVNIVSTLTTDWLQYSVSGTAPAGTTIIRAVFAGSNFTGTEDPRGMKFDDADVSAVPEPATLLLLSGGLIGLFSVVRKKK